jgi:hypothetical protein
MKKAKIAGLRVALFAIAMVQINPNRYLQPQKVASDQGWLLNTPREADR